MGCNQKGAKVNGLALDTVRETAHRPDILNEGDISLLLGDSLIHQNVKVIQLGEKAVLKDSASEYRQMCAQWTLNNEQVLEIVGMSKIISGSEMHDLYYDLPCRFNSKIEIKGREYNVIINGGSFLYIYNELQQFYLGCSSDECKKYFLEQGGDRNRDIPDY
jgi:hypothetical protein